MTTQTNTYLKRKAAAAWAGLMIGDALGASAEFCYHEDIMAMYPDGLQDMVPGFCICKDRLPGVVTDDTQMAYCLRLALQDANGWSREAALKRYQEWLATDPPDIGEATERALRGNPDFESQGNGALMRVLPIALWAAEHPDFDWQTAAREDAAITHPNPLCAEINVVFVQALLTAMQRNSTKEDILLSAMSHAEDPQLYAMLLDVRTPGAMYPDYDGEHIGWVILALQGAFYQLMNAPTFRAALVDVVSAGGDTDTNAAITGALLGAWKGTGCLERSWLATVRAANPSHYTELLPTVKALPPYPVALTDPKTGKRSARRLGGIPPVRDFL